VQQPAAPAAEESVRNMIVSDWPIIIIRPGGYIVRVPKKIHGNKNDVQIRVCDEHPPHNKFFKNTIIPW
jgi:hypothetical protein